ncbi:hypothetical protein Hanom_Chr14g01324391 [Helianthus anomalus]
MFKISALCFIKVKTQHQLTLDFRYKANKGCSGYVLGLHCHYHHVFDHHLNCFHHHCRRHHRHCDHHHLLYVVVEGVVGCAAVHLIVA